MTTPTREQVIEWAKEAGLPDAIAAHPGVKHALALAISAGREQGLREAYDIALRAPFKQSELDADEWESPEAAHDAGLKSMAFDITSEIRAAIEQLRGK